MFVPLRAAHTLVLLAYILWWAALSLFIMRREERRRKKHAGEAGREGRRRKGKGKNIQTYDRPFTGPSHVNSPLHLRLSLHEALAFTACVTLVWLLFLEEGQTVKEETLGCCNINKGV